MASHAVVLLNHPPAFLNVVTVVAGLVLVAGGQRRLFAALQEGAERANLVFVEMHIGHAQSFGFTLDLALVINLRFGEFVLEESLVIVPGALGRAMRQASQIFLIGDGLFFAALRVFGEKGEVKALDRFRAFEGELSPYAAFVFHAGYFVASGAAIVTHPLLSFGLERGIIHE